MYRKSFIVLAVTLLIFIPGMYAGLAQEEEADKLDAAKVMRRLDEVLANQAEIFKQFAEIRQELAIIKIRASR